MLWCLTLAVCPGPLAQDDAHIFCLPGQIAPEIERVLTLVEDIMTAFGFDPNEFEVRRPLPLLPDRASLHSATAPASHSMIANVAAGMRRPSTLFSDLGGMLFVQGTKRLLSAHGPRQTLTGGSSFPAGQSVDAAREGSGLRRHLADSRGGPAGGARGQGALCAATYS